MEELPSEGVPVNKRKSTGKAQRFRIFTRDGFSCKYCGRQSDEVKLVIDHVIPICKGGTSDDANLISACEACNQGKAGHSLTSPPSEENRLRLAQEMREQQEAAENARHSAIARSELRQSIVDYFCSVRGTTSACQGTISTLVNFSGEFGIEKVFTWIDIASNRLHPGASETKFIKYICGIRRNEKASQEDS